MGPFFQHPNWCISLFLSAARLATIQVDMLPKLQSAIKIACLTFKEASRTKSKLSVLPNCKHLENALQDPNKSHLEACFEAMQLHEEFSHLVHISVNLDEKVAWCRNQAPSLAASGEQHGEKIMQPGMWAL